MRHYIKLKTLNIFRVQALHLLLAFLAKSSKN